MVDLFKQILILTFVLTSGVILYAQTPFVKSYGIDEGLPFQEVSHITRGQDGRLWLQSSAEYITAFDGRGFENHKAAESGVNSFVHATHANKDGIWLAEKNRCSLYSDGSWYQLPMLDSVVRFQFFGDSVLACDNNFGYYPYRLEKEEFGEREELQIKEVLKSLDPNGRWYLDRSGNMLIYIVFRGPQNQDTYLFPDKCLKEYHLFKDSRVADLGKSTLLIIPFTDNTFSLWKDGRTHPIENTLIGFPATLKHHFIQPSYESNFGHTVSFIHKGPTESDQLHCATLDIRQCKIVENKLAPISSVIDFIKDRFGNYWFASHTGFHKVNYSTEEYNSESIPTLDALSGLIEDDEGRMWFTGYKTGLAFYENDTIIRFDIKGRSRNTFLPGAFKSRDGEVMFFNNAREILGIKDMKSRFYKLYENGKRILKTGYFIDSLESGQIVLGLHKRGLGLVERIHGDSIHVKVIDEKKGVTIENVLTISEDKNNRLWLGRSSKGLALYNPEKDTAYTWLRDPANNRSFGALSSEVDTLGNLWLGAHNGLYFIKDPHVINPETDNPFERAINIPMPNGDSSLVIQLKQYGNYMIIGNTSAVSFLDLNDFYGGNKPRIYQLFFGKDIGGKGCEQNAIYIDSKRRIWIGTQTGAIKIDFENLVFDTLQNNIKLKKVTCGGSTVPFENNKIKIPTDNRNFKFEFTATGQLSLMDNIFLEYTLYTHSGDTLIHREHQSNLSFAQEFISPGKYFLEVIARKNGLTMDQATIYAIIVPLNLSENPLFWAGFVGFIMLLSFSFYVIKAKQDKMLLVKDMALKDLRNEKEHLQIQSIINSFNPHFINNSLHWAQSRYRKDPELVMLISKLSKNIRYIFKKSLNNEAVHTLGEEITLVENYISIQKLRFNDSFKFILKNPEFVKKNKDFKVLVMQLQIHIENAIEHGLRNRKESSFVELELLEEGDFWAFVIRDDGIGYNNTDAEQSHGTQSGTRMLADLHSIFNQNNPLNICTIYENNIFEDNDGTGYGTRVIIKLPKEYSYEL